MALTAGNSIPLASYPSRALQIGDSRWNVNHWPWEDVHPCFPYAIPVVMVADPVRIILIDSVMPHETRLPILISDVLTVLLEELRMSGMIKFDELEVSSQQHQDIQQQGSSGQQVSAVQNNPFGQQYPVLPIELPCPVFPAGQQHPVPSGNQRHPVGQEYSIPPAGQQLLVKQKHPALPAGQQNPSRQQLSALPAELRYPVLPGGIRHAFEPNWAVLPIELQYPVLTVDQQQPLLPIGNRYIYRSIEDIRPAGQQRPADRQRPAQEPYRLFHVGQRSKDLVDAYLQLDAKDQGDKEGKDDKEGKGKGKEEEGEASGSRTPRATDGETSMEL